MHRKAGRSVRTACGVLASSVDIIGEPRRTFVLESWRRVRGLYWTMVYNRKGVVILRMANIFLVLEVIYTYMKYIHPDSGIGNYRFHSERKQTRFKREQLVRLCCSMPMHLALMHGVQFQPSF